MTEVEMFGWHHRLDGHGFGWTLGVGDGRGGLECCGSWGRKDSTVTAIVFHLHTDPAACLINQGSPFSAFLPALNCFSHMFN